MNEKIHLSFDKLDDIKNGYNAFQKVTCQSEPCYSIDDAVNKAGYGKFQVRLLILAGLGWFADAAEIFILSLIGDFVACDWELHRWQIALLTSVVFAGVMMGSPVFGIIADIYGRKRALSVSVIFIFVFGAVSAASPNFIWMVVLRICLGFALGGVSQGFILCTEYCPSNIRGKTGFYLCYFWSLGTVVIVLLTWVIMVYINNWRILLLAAAVPSLLVVISLKWLPESARYYLVSNQYKKATAILRTMAKENKSELPPGKLIEISDIHRRGNIRDLFGKQYRWITLLGWYLWLATAFAYYGIALVSPIIIQNGNLVNAVNNKNDSFFDDMDSRVQCINYSNQFYIDILWTSAAEFPGIILFTFLIEHTGRKYLFAISCFVSSVFIMCLLFNTYKIIMLLLLFASRGLLAAITQLSYVITSEIFPTTFRSLAMGTSSSFCRIGGIIVPYVAQVLVYKNPIAAMVLLAGALFLSAVAALLLPYETKGKEMKEVPLENE